MAAPLALLAASALPAVPAAAAAPRATAHFTSGTASLAPACAATASCHYHVYGTEKGDFPRLHVVNGPNNLSSADIDYDLYVPDVATAVAPQPAIMYFNGFAGAKNDSSGTGLGKFFASHGYVYLPFTSEGFGNSAGKIELDSPEYDVKNAEALITSVLATKSYVLHDATGDPRVGLTGGSYGGAIQLLTAEFDPRVDAITPFRTWNTLEYSLGPNNLQSHFLPQGLPCCGVLKTEWTSLFFVDGLTQPFLGNGSGRNAIPSQLPCPGYDARICPVYVDSVAHGSVSDGSDPTRPFNTRAIIQNSSPASYFNGGTSADSSQHSSGLNVPTLIGQGEEDTLFNLNDGIANYLAIQARGVPVKMLWHSNGHGYPDLPGEDDAFGGDVSNPNQNYIPQRLLAWFNRYLRLDTSVDTGPGFSYFRDWVPYDPKGSAAPAYGTAAGYPAQAPLTFTLSGTKDLVLPGQPAAAGTAQVVNPPLGQPASYTETSNFQCSTCYLPQTNQAPFAGIQPSNPPCAGICEYADFTSAPFGHDLVSVGVPTAHLHITALSAQPVFYGKVYDVAPDGSFELVKRLIAPVRVFDTSQPVDFQLLGLAHRFAAGHAVRLEIAATDQTSGSNRPPDLIGIVAGASTDPSTFSLPVDAAANAVPAPVTLSGPGMMPNTAVGRVTPLGRDLLFWLGVAIVLVVAAVAMLALRRRRD
ncbi:MAG TPA: CocE/NonD family hydrolase [Candidatus Dormibacteraeota bacterium]|jgi:ABC-2 type transport system ATP-binding protein